MAKRTALGPLAVVSEYQRPALTARGLAVVHALRLAEAVRELDAADREATKARLRAEVGMAEVA